MRTDNQDTLRGQEQTPEENYQLALQYLEGDESQSIEKDVSRAITFFELAADKEHVEAQYQLGMLYLNGFGCTQNDETAKRWFQRAGLKKHTEAMCCLALIEMDQKNYPTAIALYEAAANAGHVDAQYKMGLLYLRGHGVAQNYKIAREWFKGAAKDKYPAALHELGCMYAKGWGVIQDHETAKNYFLEASQKNHAESSYCLGLLYLHGVLLPDGYTIDFLSPNQDLKPGTIYVEYDGLDLNYKALSFFSDKPKEGVINFLELPELDELSSDSLSLDDIEPLSPAILKIVFLRNDIEPEADYNNARHFLEHAVDHGHVESMYQLGLMYEVSVRHANNDQEAKELCIVAKCWFETAAKENHPDAQYRLGLLYEEGFGCEKNIEKAGEWFQKAAEQQHEEAAKKCAALFLRPSKKPRR